MGFPKGATACVQPSPSQTEGCLRCDKLVCECPDNSLGNQISNPVKSFARSDLRTVKEGQGPQATGIAITWMSPAPFTTGAFSNIFEAIHIEFGRVALKQLRMDGEGNIKDWIRRFKREADTSRKLQHQYILQALETLEFGGHFYIVLPFRRRGTILDYVSCYPQVNRIRLLCMTADGLRYLHENHIVHGDIKAINILMNDDGSPQLCDFGLAKPIDTRTSAAMRGSGTLRWQSPELWDDDASKTFSSDVYAFSMTIVEVLTGELPYKDIQKDGAVVLAVKLTGRRPPKAPTESPTGIPYDNIWEVATACWQQDPTERLTSAEAHIRIAADPCLYE